MTTVDIEDLRTRPRGRPPLVSDHPLRRYRLKHGLSLKAFGEVAGCSKQHVSKIERRLYTPSMALLQRIVDRTSLKAEDFLRQPTAEAAE
jgi:transcriptional regulator with XRE-family HTH domain